CHPDYGVRYGVRGALGGRGGTRGARPGHQGRQGGDGGAPQTPQRSAVEGARGRGGGHSPRREEAGTETSQEAVSVNCPEGFRRVCPAARPEKPSILRGEPVA